MDAQKLLSQKEMMEKINSFDERISKIEALLSEKPQIVRSYSTTSHADDEVDTSQEMANSFSESKVFEYGLAWIGSAILLLGMIFMMSFINAKLGGISSCLLGLSSAALTFVLARYLKKTLAYMSFLFTLCGHFLIYFSLLKLHFFVDSPVIGNAWLVLLLLLSSLTVQFQQSIQLKSEFQAIISFILLIFTALFADSTYFTFSLLIAGSAMAIYLFDKYHWSALLILSIILVYLAHTVWLIGNPLMGHPAAAVATHQYNLLFLFLYGAVFAMVSFLKQKNPQYEPDIYNAAIIINGFAFSMLLFLNVLTFFPTSYIFLFLGISIACLIFSIVLNYKIDSKFDSSFYVNFSFMALSIAAYGYSNIPGSFIFLAWQSLVVLAIAIWFRSNLIVMMNTLLYSLILISFLAIAKPIDSYDFSFVIIAIVSARILNWQKDRLELKTEMIRNIYLVITFFSMLYALYYAVPKEYVTMSWGLSAIFYMILSVLLKNNKYRWLAIMTLVVTVFYLFIFDLSKMEMGYRIMAFGFVGLTILGLSFYYTKKLKREKE